MEDDIDKLTVNPLVTSQPMEAGAVLLNTKTGDCFELNRLGAEVWHRLTKDEPLESIVAVLAVNYNLAVPKVASDVRDLLTELSRLGLVTSLRR